MNNKWLMAATAILTVSPPVQAQNDISYTYIEADALYFDFDGGEEELGFGAQGSAALGNRFYLFGEYANVEPDSVELQSFTGGLGAHFPLAPQTDLILEGAYERAEAEFGPFESNLDGFSAAGGVRSALTSGFELTVKAGYADFEDGVDTVFGRASGLFKLTPTFGIDTLFEIDDDGDIILGAGVRASF